ncbi:hypothetical protein A5893_12900 [Pedobacter psychrophilus]|uniref:Uncharacterized protein n=1 Tax=Pedobacter psychrophilus TaxID=1826909 RepID=A0A179DE07_9SPHI|nr:hypothetical protein [Pedobacter psychrophilus]OAQ38930.1 hypothetical protein A5893_12900 [Pedobacter psychrophilus]
MTFQEFFLKKKIDLEALQTDKPDLFLEFQEHYSLMGNKSFDHTKKYWFNNLRRDFPLSEEKENNLKEAFKPKEILQETPIKSEEILNETKPATGFKPRFKASVVIKSEEKKEEAFPTETPSPTFLKPPPFKPRFKAGATKSVENSEIIIEKETLPVEIAQENLTKPVGFKPRFKAGTTNSTKTDESVDDKNIVSSLDMESITPKPLGFKPRFKK